MNKQRKVLNPQVFLELMCYITFSALLIYLAWSGKYQSYVTPKMLPYLYFAASVMLIWTGVGMFRLFRPQHKTRVAHCFVLVIPIILYLLPHNSISASDLSSGYLSGNTLVGLTGQSGKGNATGNPASSANGATDSNSANDTNNGITSDSPDESQQNDLPGLDVKNKKITVDDDRFGMWLSELYTNMEKYEGYQISIKGFVYKDPETMKSNEFVPARLMMSCCSADLSPFGIICKYDKASELKKDTWLTVEGTIHVGQYMDQDEPQVTVTKTSPAQKVDGYIFP
jgi:putative membrane protein